MKPVIELRMDRLTEKRVTIFDQAVLGLFQDRAAISSASVSASVDLASKKSGVESPKLLETSRVVPKATD